MKLCFFISQQHEDAKRALLTLMEIKENSCFFTPIKFRTLRGSLVIFLGELLKVCHSGAGCALDKRSGFPELIAGFLPPRSSSVVQVGPLISLVPAPDPNLDQRLNTRPAPGSVFGFWLRLSSLPVACTSAFLLRSLSLSAGSLVVFQVIFFMFTMCYEPPRKRALCASTGVGLP